MSGDWLRVMMALDFSHVTSVANGSGASSRVQPLSKSSRFWSSKRPVALVAAPRPRLRSAGRMRSAIASGRWRGSMARVRFWLMGMFRNVRFGTNHEHEIGPPTCRVKGRAANSEGATRPTSPLYGRWVSVERCERRTRRSVRERVAVVDIAALQARGQTFLALRRGSVGEAVAHGVAAGGGLEPVVAYRLRRRQRPLDIARLEDLPFVVRVVGPHAVQAIGLQFAPDGQRVGLGLAHPLLHVVDLVENAENVLNMMADLMGYDIEIGEFAAAAVLVFHIAKEGCVEINLLVDRAVERPHRRLCAAAPGARRPVVDDERRRLVLDTRLRRQHFRPDCLRAADDLGEKSAHRIVWIGRRACRRRGALLPDANHFGPAHEHLRRDAGEITDGENDDDGADA